LGRAECELRGRAITETDQLDAFSFNPTHAVVVEYRVPFVDEKDPHGGAEDRGSLDAALQLLFGNTGDRDTWARWRQINRRRSLDNRRGSARIRRGASTLGKSERVALWFGVRASHLQAGLQVSGLLLDVSRGFNAAARSGAGRSSCPRGGRV
jgi:hypothetical protein